MAGLAEVIDPFAELLDGVVELVGVVVEEGQEHLLAALLVAPRPGGGRLAGELLDGQLRLARVMDAVVPKPVVERLETSSEASCGCS